MEQQILQDQIQYYRARAGEYDEWFFRKGRYDRGELANAQWFKEVEHVQSALKEFNPSGHVLEIAGGTGLWTQILADFAVRVTVVDSSSEMLKINRSRVQHEEVEYIQANIFEWQSEQRFDTVFFSFWLSHVPAHEFERFWHLVRSVLKPEGRVFLVDSRFEPASTASDHHLNDKDNPIVTRKLNGGATFDIYKIFYETADLEARLSALGWRSDLRVTDRFFIFGNCWR